MLPAKGLRITNPIAKQPHYIIVNTASTSDELLRLLNEKLGKHIIESKLDLGDAVIRITRPNMLDFFRLLKLDAELSFNLLISVTVVDWMDKRDDRFEAVYHLLSLKNHFRLRVKIDVPEEDAKVDSICSLWSGANFMEREAWDMYGVTFTGHPDLRRILTYDEFKGHPLRKDYPVQAKQPRIPLRAPEVENTARRMNRPDLVKINKKKAEGSSRTATH